MELQKAFDQFLTLHLQTIMRKTVVNYSVNENPESRKHVFCILHDLHDVHHFEMFTSVQL